MRKLVGDYRVKSETIGRGRVAISDFSETPNVIDKKDIPSLGS